MDRDFSYVAFYEFDFNEQCNLCLLQAFGYTEGYYIDTDIVKLEVNKESLQEFFLALKQKYNDHILAVVYKFINVAIVITEENADKIENVKYKGGQLLDEDGNLKQMKTREWNMCKQKCMEENNVKLVVKKDIIKIMKIVDEKYGKN